MAEGVRMTGDFDALRRLIKRMDGLAGPGFKTKLNTQLAAEARTQIMLEFEQSRDPYGVVWTPLRSREGMPLLDTGRLRNSFSARASGRGFRVSTNVKYAGTHQYGATIKAKTAGKPLRFKVGGPRGRDAWRSKYQVKVPKRQMIPEGRLGAVWTSAFKDVAETALREGVL